MTPCNWDTHFEHMPEKACSRLYILRICKYYGYSLQELTILFESLIVSIFKYAFEIWTVACYNKYLFQIDRFCKRAVRYGYTNKVLHITDLIRILDRQLWKKLSVDKNHPLKDLLILQRKGVLGKRRHNYILPSVKNNILSDASLIDAFSVLSHNWLLTRVLVFYCFSRLQTHTSVTG